MWGVYESQFYITDLGCGSGKLLRKVFLSVEPLDGEMKRSTTAWSISPMTLHARNIYIYIVYMYDR